MHHKTTDEIIEMLNALATSKEVVGNFIEADCLHDAVKELKNLQEKILNLECELELFQHSGGYGI